MSYNTAFHFQSGDRFEHRQGTLHEGGRASSGDVSGETLWRSCSLPGHHCVFELGFHLGFWIVLVLPFLLLFQGGTCPDILMFSISFVRIHVETRVFAGACMWRPDIDAVSCDRVSLWPGTHQLSRLVVHHAPGAWLCLPSSRIISTCHYAQLLKV